MRASEHAQGSIEFVAATSLLALAALACLQAMLLATGAIFAQVAVDRAATGLSDEQVVRSLPQPWRDDAAVVRSASDERVMVRISVPLLVPGIDAPPLSLSASAREQGST